MVDRVRCRLGAVLAGALLTAAALCACPALFAQERFPSQSIELIVPWGRGGQTDIVGRKLAPLLRPLLGVEIDVVNVPGANGNAGLTKMLMNPPDGYTMTLVGLGTYASWEHGIGFARLEDLRVIAVLTETSAMLFVRSDSPFKTFREFLDHAKAKPDSLRLSSWGSGAPDISVRVLASQGYKLIHMPFAKSEQRAAAVLGRRADALYEPLMAVESEVRSNRLRPLVIFDDKRDPAFPNVPSVSEMGLEPAGMRTFVTLALSAKTPADRIEILGAAVAKAMETPEWRDYCQATRSCAQKYTRQQIDAKLQAFRDALARYSPVPAR